MSAPRITDDWVARLRELKPNWNSYGAPAISEAAIEALGLFYAVPMIDGGIQMEAHFGGKDLEIEIGPDGKIRSLYCAEV
jgi:hypothetical protein